MFPLPPVVHGGIRVHREASGTEGVSMAEWQFGASWRDIQGKVAGQAVWRWQSRKMSCRWPWLRWYTKP